MIRHPQAQRLQDQSFAITGWWTLFVCTIFLMSIVLLPSGMIGRGMGWMLIFLPALPGFTIFFLVKCFPRYRVTRCPFCGFQEIRKLVSGGWRR